MDFKKSKTLLFKIQTLLETFSGQESETSRLERDLLKSYIRDLYEAVSEDTSIQSRQQDPEPQPKEEKQISTKKEESGIEKARTTKPHYQPDTPKTVKQETPDAVVEIHEKESDLGSAKANIHSTDHQQNKPENAAPPVTFVELNTLENLFEIQPLSDLSDKYRQSPITDISKSMGINERILTINELFGGSQDLFNETIKGLNSFHSFDEAKSFLLSGVASDLNWAHDVRIEKAKRFISIIRRKYQS